MRFDPHVWFVSLPLALALVWAMGLPDDHRFKRWWTELREMDDLFWQTVGWDREHLAYQRILRLQLQLFLLALGGLLALSLASLWSFVLG